MCKARDVYIIISLALMAIVFAGCGKPEKPISHPERNSKDQLVLTENIIFPGSQHYFEAKYDYLSEESPEKVVSWFKTNLDECVVEEIADGIPEETRWVVKHNDINIRIYQFPEDQFPEGNKTLIRYIKDLHYNESPE